MNVKKIDGWETTDGRIFSEQREAERAEGVYQLNELLQECIDWRGEELDIDQVRARGPGLIAALQAAG